MNKIIIAGDHAAVEFKKKLIERLKSINSNDLRSCEIEDLGPFELNSVDYPDYADKLCEKIKPDDTNTLGLLICGSGQGMAMRANKFSHIRAALVYSDEIAKLAKEHNFANVLCFGSRLCTVEEALRWIKLFIDSKFSEGRHLQRVKKINLPTEPTD